MAIKKITAKKIAEPKIECKYQDLSNNVKGDNLQKIVNDDILEGCNDYHNLRLKNTFIEYYVNSLPNCCGILELGEFYIESNNNNKSIDIDELIIYFDLLPAFNKGITLMINTNGIEASKHLEKALSKCKNWTAVKRFNNANSGNTVTIWLSNND